jgi:hydrogenase nickel incorporation protein HypB
MERVAMEGKVLSENARVAAELRERFREHRVFVVNLISSPGSGKTTLLEKTLEKLPAGSRVAVLTGDLQAVWVSRETDCDGGHVPSGCADD